jgi:hypothetical protein
MNRDLMSDDLQLIKIKASAPFKDYLHVLQLYWQEDYELCVTQLSGLLRDYENHDFAPQLYRLWFEVLAENSDLDSINILAQHLHGLFEAIKETPRRIDYLALSALCNLELNNLDAAQFANMVCQKFPENCYCRELSGEIALRLSSNDSVAENVVQNSYPLDYFYFVGRARLRLKDRDYSSLNELLSYLAKLYDGTPIINLFSFHLAFEASDFVSALNFSERLLRSYPKNASFMLFKSYCLDKLNDRELAQKSYNKAAEQIKKNDPYEGDFMMAPTNIKQTQNEVASSASVREASAWLLTLNSAQYFELLENEQKESEYYYSLGKEVIAGDLVFAINKSERNTKIVAVFSVNSSPEWHPMYGFRTRLLTIGRVLPAIEIDMRQDKRQEQRSGARHQMQKTNPKLIENLYQLDAAALDVLSQYIEEYVKDGYVVDEQITDRVAAIRMCG